LATLVLLPLWLQSHIILTWSCYGFQKMAQARQALWPSPLAWCKCAL
jgi:hypothetical protein